MSVLLWHTDTDCTLVRRVDRGQLKDMDMLHSECQLGGSCRAGRWNGQSGRIRHSSWLLFWRQLPVTVRFFIFTLRKIKAKISLQWISALPHLSSLVTSAHFSCLFSYKCAEQSERNISQDNCFSSFLCGLQLHYVFWLDSSFIFWLLWLHYLFIYLQLKDAYFHNQTSLASIFM